MAKKQKGRNSVKCFDMEEILPKTDNQAKAFQSEKNLVLAGSAGTGKSFISCYMAIESVLDRRDYRNIVIVRSAVPTRDIGFLPGDDKEKVKIYEEPYAEIFSDILNRGDAYTTMKHAGIVEFLTTSFLRGINIRNSIVIVDECQNMSLHELDSVITRIGNNCRIIFCGDFKQADLKNNGMGSFLRILDAMGEDFDIVEFTTADIVRSDFVRRYLIAKEEMSL